MGILAWPLLSTSGWRRGPVPVPNPPLDTVTTPAKVTSIDLPDQKTSVENPYLLAVSETIQRDQAGCHERTSSFLKFLQNDVARICDGVAKILSLDRAKGWSRFASAVWSLLQVDSKLGLLERERILEADSA